MQFTLGSRAHGQRRDDAKPLRFLILGDFSGRSESNELVLPTKVGVDDLDRSIVNSKPVLRIEAPADGAADQGMPLTSLDELHPDHFATVIPDLGRLLELKRQLDTPSTEQAALTELEAVLGPLERPATRPEKATNPTTDESNEDLLGRLLGQNSHAQHDDRAKETVKQLIKDALGSKRVEQPSTLARSAHAQIATRLEERCRQILHNPRFRDVERAWRSVHWLLTRLHDDQAEVHLLDFSKPALAEHVAAFGQRLDTSPLHRVLNDSEDGWDLIVGDYSFGLTADDLVLLATIGALAAQCKAPFLAHGELSLAGCPNAQAIGRPWEWSFRDDALGQLWAELRRHPAAHWIGLAVPRFVLRYPYGAKNDPVERFELEELSVEPEPDRFLWGNPALACAVLMAQAHTAGGACWPSPTGGDVLDLPTPLYRDAGGEAIQPPLEYLFNERAAAAVRDHGLIPFSSGRNTNRIATSAFMSLAST